MKIIFFTIFLFTTILSANQKEILALGDSLTYGYKLKRDQSYPSHLEKFTGIKVINAGVNGIRSDRGSYILSKHINNENIKIMILFLGGNDILQRRNMNTLKENLRKTIKEAKAKKIKVLLVSFPTRTKKGIKELPLYKELSKEEQVPVVSNIYAKLIEYPKFKIDKVHLNGNGYKLLAKTIFIKLKKLRWI